MAGKNEEDGRTSNANEIRNILPSVMPAFPPDRSDIPSDMSNIPSVRSNIPSVRSSVIPDIPSASPSVIPDIFNRESRSFSQQGYMKEGTRKKDTGFPLKTCGNDRGSKRFRPVIPDIFNRESRGVFPNEGTRMKGQKRKTLDSR